MANREQQAGITMMAMLLSLTLLAALSISLLSVTSSANQQQLAAERAVKIRYLAEAGLRQAVIELSAGGDGILGSPSAPVEFGGGSYYVFTTDNLDGTYLSSAVGQFGGRRKVLRAGIRKSSGVFSSAIYAGNSSGDPNYELEFGGVGAHADQITGDIYSGGSIRVVDEASITGELSASGSISGAEGKTGVELTAPDLVAMNFEVNHDVNVAAEFQAYGSLLKDDAGGTAWQLPEDKASHIFRLNPDDRRSEIESTVKDDYFIEDPYEIVGVDPKWDGSDAYPITLAGMGSKPGPDSNNQVYFIDGNLWFHNIPTYSFKLVSPSGDPVQITLVVKGNIYISDNLFYEDKLRDAIALIALEDDSVSDSGNIYMGDPRGGTLETMHAFMYAQNNFVDNNLNSSGSDNMILYGTMSAGNHVAIERDFEGQHCRFEMEFDERLVNGAVTLPKVPLSRGETKYELYGWHEVGDPSQ